MWAYVLNWRISANCKHVTRGLVQALIGAYVQSPKNAPKLDKPKFCGRLLRSEKRVMVKNVYGLKVGHRR